MAKKLLRSLKKLCLWQRRHLKPYVLISIQAKRCLVRSAVFFLQNRQTAAWQTGRQTAIRQIDSKQADRQHGKQTDRQHGKQTDRQHGKQTEWQTDSMANRQTDSMTHRQTDSIANRQTDSMANKYTDRQHGK